MRKEIVEIIEKEVSEKGLLGDFAGRTHVFTGSHKNIKTERREFSRYGENGEKRLKPSILTQVYRKLYPQNENIEINKLVWFENLRYDCTYLKKPQEILSGHKFPVDWDYDCIIEVENNIKEFAFTLRTLLDVVCKKRVAIFFWDNFNVKEHEEVHKFKCKCWQPFKKRYQFIDEFELYVIIFPEKYEDAGGRTYFERSKSYKWDTQKEEFKEWR